MVAVFEGTMPAQTRPYRYRVNYLAIIFVLSVQTPNSMRRLLDATLP